MSCEQYAIIVYICNFPKYLTGDTISMPTFCEVGGNCWGKLDLSFFLSLIIGKFGSHFIG